jgi:hypothetical protein
MVLVTVEEDDYLYVFHRPIGPMHQPTERNATDVARRSTLVLRFKDGDKARALAINKQPIGVFIVAMAAGNAPTAVNFVCVAGVLLEKILRAWSLYASRAKPRLGNATRAGSTSP